MPEIEVKFATRYIRRKRSNAVGKSLLKTLTEPITNSDDSYSRLLSRKKIGGIYPITIFLDCKKRLIRIIDQAEGMTKKELVDKFKTYGSDESGASHGQQVRGIFGQGISDALFYHSKSVIKSIKNKEASVCMFYEKKGRPFINVRKASGSIAKLSKIWGINSKHGTLVEFVLNKNTPIHDYKKLRDYLSSFYMLRFINSDDTRSVKMIYRYASGKIRKSVINYFFPKGELMGSKKFAMQFEKYDPVKIDVKLYKSKERLKTISDERENGLLVFDDKKVVYDLTFFGLDKLPGADRFYGFMKLVGAREIILDKINNKKNPEEILTDSRNGFNTHHDFYKQLEGPIKDWLYPILSEERKDKSDEGLSRITKEKHRRAFDELNKLYLELTGEGYSGTIRSKKLRIPPRGFEFARSNISVTVNKTYALHLLIDTKVIKPKSVIELSSSKKEIGFTPEKIIIEKPKNHDKRVLIKTVTVTGDKPNIADTLIAKFKQYSSSIVVSVVPEEIFYPENGLAFYPDYFRAIVGRENALNLYVDLTHIKKGSKIILTCSEDSIKLRNKEIIVSRKFRLRSTSVVVRIPVFFEGGRVDESGIIEAKHLDYSAQARVDIKKRIIKEPTSPAGKFKDWAFDNRVTSPFQVTYDSNPQSPTYGYILINPNHPINLEYFGKNPKKSNVEDFLKAQLYLAELILTESLNVSIPEALQKGRLPRRLGDYDVLYYIAQKKFEHGPSIYKYFIEEQPLRETKIKQKLQVISDADLLKGLSDRKRQMIEMRFGLNNQRPNTLEEIGRKFDITRERVRQIINQILAKKYGDYNYIEDVHDYIGEKEKEMITSVDKILKVVSNFYQLNISQLKERSRIAHIVRARQVAMYLMRILLNLSFPSIARIFRRDHTTVLYSFEKIMDDIKQNKAFEKQIETIKNLLVD